MTTQVSEVETHKPVRRVNLGCGLNPFPGWENVDRSLGPWLARHRVLTSVLKRTQLLSPYQQPVSWDPTIRRVDVLEGLPWPDRSVDVVYSANMLHRLPRAAVGPFLSECLRVLKDGGLLRIGVPDLGAAARAYVEQSDRGNETAADGFMRWLDLAPRLRRAGRRPYGVLLVLRRRPRQWMYDFPSLKAALDKAGFEQVVQCPTRQGRCPDLEHEAPDLGATAEQFTFNLFAEAIRPAG